MIDTYRTFEDLAAHAVEGKDFRIVTRKPNAPFLIMAIHGGNIEPFTSDVAMAIAGEDHGLYLFEGIKESGNRELHIESEYFDEPIAKDMVRGAEVIVSIHGHRATDAEFVTVGGSCAGLVEKAAAHIREIDIAVRAVEANRCPDSPRNICNHGMSGEGVEIELSRKLRDALREDVGLYRLFTNAVRHAIATYHIT